MGDPEDREMVLVRGNTGETWLGHVQKVDQRKKTCQIFFYVESSPDVYCCENRV